MASSEVRWTTDRSGDVYLIVYGFDEESIGTYRLEVYSTSEAMKEEKLAALSLLPGRADEMVGAVDDQLYVSEDDSSWNAWDSGDQSDEDVWSAGVDELD